MRKIIWMGILKFSTIRKRKRTGLSTILKYFGRFLSPSLSPFLCFSLIRSPHPVAVFSWRSSPEAYDHRRFTPKLRLPQIARDTEITLVFSNNNSWEGENSNLIVFFDSLRLASSFHKNFVMKIEKRGIKYDIVRSKWLKLSQECVWKELVFQIKTVILSVQKQRDEKSEPLWWVENIITKSASQLPTLLFLILEQR